MRHFNETPGGWRADGGYVQRRWSRPGKVRHGILLWLLGVPIPLILLFFLIRGCVA